MVVLELEKIGVQALLEFILSSSLSPRPGTAISHSPGPWTPARAHIDYTRIVNLQLRLSIISCSPLYSGMFQVDDWFH